MKWSPNLEGIEDKRSGWVGPFHPLSILMLGSQSHRGIAPTEGRKSPTHKKENKRRRKGNGIHLREKTINGGKDEVMEKN
jgi:hypothetical protein